MKQLFAQFLSTSLRFHQQFTYFYLLDLNNYGSFQLDALEDKGKT